MASNVLEESKNDPYRKFPIFKPLVNLSINVINLIWVEQSFLNQTKSIWNIKFIEETQTSPMY